MSALRLLLALLFAVLAGVGFAQQNDPSLAIGAENDDLSARIAEATIELDLAAGELAELRKAKADLDTRLRWVQRRASVHALGPEFAQTLTELRRQLPTPQRLSGGRERRAEQLAAASDSELAVKRALHALDDVDAAIDHRLAAAQPPLADEERLPLAAALRAAFVEQRDLLKGLQDLQAKRLDVLQQADEAARELQRQADAAHTELTQLLFWTPASPTSRTLDELLPSLAWTVAPAHWRAAGEILRHDLLARPLWPTVAVLAAASLLLRSRWQRALVSLSPAVVSGEHYRIRHALLALAITLALALPAPIMLWTAAHSLASAHEGQSFPLALAGALQTIARLLLALLTFAWLLDRSGVAVRHFGWDETSVPGAARALRWFAAVVVPLLFVAVLNGLDNAPFANRESLGRLAFCFALIAAGVFLAGLLRRSGPLLQRWVTHAARSWAVRLHAVWFACLVAVPCAVAALALAGYFVAAGYVFSRLVYTLFLSLAAVTLYGLMALWVQIQRQQIARRQVADGVLAIDAEGAAEAGSLVASETSELRRPRLDLAALGEETRSLLDFVVTVLLLGGLWWVWQDAVATLGLIGDYTLWSYTETVEGKEVAHALTVSRLLLALLVIGVSALLVRRVGALLGIVLLQRFELQADAIYAITVVTRYAIAAAGIIIASGLLGIAWNDVQWLVAALGVGLGFGLQEIVANFVSGLIVLAERPIRIGDVVTVDDISGTVGRIRARATAVIDFDNKEVIIPNKAFITGRVVNWTLTNQTTRLLLKVGVAYGSDIARVQRLLLEVVRSNREVLPEPAPSVFCAAFGESSLDFEIRAFVDSFDKRLRVQHEINRDIARVLGEQAIEIPFPQRDLHIRTAPGPFPETSQDDQHDPGR